MNANRQHVDDEDVWLSRAEAEEMVRQITGRRISLLRADRRYGLPGKITDDHRLLFRSSDVKRWADIRCEDQDLRTVDTRGSALGNWLYDHQKTMWGFARELGGAQRTAERVIACLCGRPRPDHREPKLAMLLRIADVTGLPVQALVADAAKGSSTKERKDAET